MRRPPRARNLVASAVAALCLVNVAGPERVQQLFQRFVGHARKREGLLQIVER